MRIHELLSTALLEAPPIVNMSDQKSGGPMKGPRKFLEGPWPPWPPPRRNATGRIQVNPYSFETVCLV